MCQKKVSIILYIDFALFTYMSHICTYKVKTERILVKITGFSPHILAHSTPTHRPGFSAGLLWWCWGRAWGPNDAAIMTFSYLPRTQDAIPMAEWLQATNTGDIFLWCGQHKGPQCPKARPLVSTRYFSRNYGAQGPPIVVWWLRSFWWSAVIRILHWSQNWKWRGGEKKKRDWLIRFVLWMVV